MNMEEEIISRLKNVRHTLHAVQEEIKDDLTAEEIDLALKNGFELVEEYLDDPRGRSCLLLCWIKDAPVHIVCAPHEDALIIITVYRPDLNIWMSNYKTRRVKGR